MSTTCLEPTGAKRPASADRGGGVTRPRWATFDLARLLGAYAIVWVHVSRVPALQSSKALGRFAVPFFVFGAVFFVIDGLRRRPWRGFAEYTRSRFVRIYLPFLAWSVVYLGLKLVKAALLPEQPNDMPGWSLLWAGSFYHLWFMPFILVVSLAAFGLGKAVLGRPRAEAALAAGCAVAGLAAALTPISAFGFPSTGRGAALAAAVPAAFWAVAFAVVYRGPVARHLKRPAALIAAGVLAVVATAWIWRCGGSSTPAATLAAAGVMVLALGPSVTGWVARLGTFGPLAYGIYLSHLLVIKLLESLLAKLGAPICWELDFGVFVVSAALSTLLAWALSRRRWSRWLVA